MENETGNIKATGLKELDAAIETLKKAREDLEEAFSKTEPTIEQISAIVASGNAREHFKIHDIIELAGREMEVIGFDHDVDAEIEGRHTMTLMDKRIIENRRMHSEEYPNGWCDTELRNGLAEYFKTLPEELRKAIRPVRKLTHNGDGTATITVDKLFVPSESEMFGTAIWSDYEDESRYEAFSNCGDRARRDEDGDTCHYWTRSSQAGSSTTFAFVGSNGLPGYAYAASTWIGAPLCFNV